MTKQWGRIVGTPNNDQKYEIMTRLVDDVKAHKNPALQQ